jgi:1-acyl-sn-glycerol-3-phosphate acyltransferase
MRALLGLLLLIVNTGAHLLPLFTLALVKLVAPFARRPLSRGLIAIGESWIAVNSWLLDHLTPTRYVVTGGERLERDGWYLVISNHQSWVDIPVLQKVFNRRIPFLKFFLKKELIWVPGLGLAWWALDFPFMHRHSAAEIARDPSLAGRDIEATRRACAKFREQPVSIMNFVEGTRFTAAKHSAQGSPFRQLLKPKAGGVAFVLEAMGEQIDTLVDVRIRYPAGRPDLFDLLGGRVPEIGVDIDIVPIPADLRGLSYAQDAAFRERFQAWLNARWLIKDFD